MMFNLKRSLALSAVTVLLLQGVAATHAQPPTAGAAPAPVRAQRVAGRVYILTGGGGANSSLLIGDDGALLVDSKSSAAAQQIFDIAARLSSGPIRFLVNGHVHPDHTDGNATFGAAGVAIIGHQEVRDVLAAGQRGGPPAPPAALPTVTYPDGGGVSLYLNGEHVDVFHAPPAHAHDNSVVHYRDSNVLHLGDLYSPSRYQLIAGGTFQGFIDAADIALDIADENTKIIPGVGAVADRAQLAAYRVMLVTVRDRVAALVAEGKSLDEVIAARPTAEFDAIWGAPDHRLFLPVLYAELAE
jgi:glyoxylase-like metal-dependent hydrolase (beta-lactamase superfamily II)